MMKNSSKVREPLFHISKNNSLPASSALIIRAVAVVVALILTGILGVLLIHESPLKIYAEIFKGPFIDIWTLLQNTAILLAFALAVIPAFKMKYFNMGANGQVLISCLTAIACMKFLSGKLPNFVVILLMIVTGIIAGVIFALIPALFKAFFGINETLFTLMMNYIAAGFVNYMVFIWDKSGSGNIGIVNLINHKGWFPSLFGNKYLLSIIVVAVMTVFIAIYMKYSKHGFELALVGESINTARYVGINVKKVIIRTLALSGALCGVLGVLYAGAIEHTINSTVGGKGFTAILVAWLADFNAPVMAVVSFLVTFLTSGTEYAASSLHLGSTDFASITVGIVFFCVIGSEFFIRYNVEFTAKGREVFRIKKIRERRTKKGQDGLK